ncbi:hypothetical protein LCGC14_1197210 [marine sediment metagenome]|uniref:Uncharacterized protein n=1 Tax=marine sediment metagenome TaxID=412755 RepID=A0A0F9M5A6_9ZZZZ
MIEVIDLQILENIAGEKNKGNLNRVFQNLFDKIQKYLDLKPYHTKVKVTFIKNKVPNISKLEDIFSIGVNRDKRDEVLIIEIKENYKKFLNFILLREIFNLFVPSKVKNYEVVQIVINQIIMTHLVKSAFLNDWRRIIREKLEDYDIISTGVSRLSSVDRLEHFFNYISSNSQQNPIQFFFKYLRENTALIRDRFEDFEDIFFLEFTNLSIYNDDLIETIRCIIEIFYKVKTYTNILNYKTYFQEFKKSGELETELSLRKFTINMDWVKKNSYIAPSYQLNWNTINVSIITVFLRFNPLLDKAKIYKMINQLPFFISPKFSYDSFALNISGYIVIPNIYLNDFNRFLERLEEFGYLIRHHCLLWSTNRHSVNLNYLREYAKKRRIINPEHNQYNLKNEIEFELDMDSNYYHNELSLLDFLMFDRIRFFSVNGLGFERKRDMIHTIKSDLLNEIITERTQIKDLTFILKNFQESFDLTTEFLHFLKANKRYGFFYIKGTLETLYTHLKFMERVLNNNSNIKNYSQFQNFVENHDLSQQIEEKILFKNIYAKNRIFKEFFTLFYQSKKEYNKRIKALMKFSDLVKACYKLKIFNLKSIKKILQDPNVVDQIYKTKESKLKKDFEKWKPYKITIQEIDNIIDKFLKKDQPLIQPLLINTIFFGKNDYLQLILTDSEEVLKQMEKIKKYFPRVLINSTKGLESNENFLYVEISTPDLNKEEKKQFFSIFYNIFKENLLYGKSFVWSGRLQAISKKNFYDFQNKQFFYTKDLYEQFFLYVQKILGQPLKKLPIIASKIRHKFWSKEKNINRLIKTMNYHDEIEKIDLTQSNLHKLVQFNLSLKENLANPKKFQEIKTGEFFKNYVKSIKCIPAFQHFGFEQFFLYMYPTDMDEIDFKLLLSNTFQKVKYPACIDESNSLLIKYLMPYRSPNLKYIHWLTKAKKIIREYVAFSVKKIYQVFQFQTNLNPDGWDYKLDKFKIYMQNILFNPNYNIVLPEMKIFDLEEKFTSEGFSPNSPEFESLSDIYNWHSIDLKSYLSGKTHVKEHHITGLLKKNLIFPYLSLKNLGFQEKIYAILPNVKKETINTLIKVFRFFNVGYFYEIGGEFYIDGFDDDEKFEYGLMIELHFPKCEIGEFEKLFELLFEYLEIKHYLLLNDLIDGKNLIKSIFGNLNFLKMYNPLKNLKWNETDNIWLSHNIF